MGCSKSVQLNDDTVYLVIDTREKKSRRDFLFFQKNLVNLNIQTRQLDLGDFVWIKNEKLFKYIVERKQATDFVQSISDGRYKLKVKKLLKLREFHVFYII
ncbi:ERCC4-type nuclease [Enterocytozoon bieneusi H348]|nr:ERCC4-type nuclease [Enterocytozoon bieneusi H348]|eukprot:XP_002652359.1 ERCC4-type nuclease [Enterocytozoon bieneusi H348]